MAAISGIDSTGPTAACHWRACSAAVTAAPLMIHGAHGWELIGLGSWITAVPEHALEAGYYGQVVHNVRISRYADWIDTMIRTAP